MKKLNLTIIALFCGLLGLNNIDVQAMELLLLNKKKPAIQQPQAAQPNGNKATQFVGGLPLPKKIYGYRFTVSPSPYHQNQIRREQRERKRAQMSDAQKLDLDLSLLRLAESYVFPEKDAGILSKIKKMWNSDPLDPLSQIQQKLEEGADPGVLIKDLNPLFSSRFDNTKYKKLLTELIHAGCLLNKVHQGNSNDTLLTIACRSRNNDIVKLLIQNKADVNMPTMGLQSIVPTTEPKYYAYLDTLKLLLDAKADPGFSIYEGTQYEDNHEKNDFLCVQYGGYPKIPDLANNVYDQPLYNRHIVLDRFARARQQVNDAVTPVLNDKIPVTALQSLILDYCAPTHEAAVAQAKQIEKNKRLSVLNTMTSNLISAISTLRHAFPDSSPTSELSPSATVPITRTSVIRALDADIENNNDVTVTNTIQQSTSPAYAGSSTSLSTERAHRS